MDELYNIKKELEKYYFFHLNEKEIKYIILNVKKENDSISMQIRDLVYKVLYNRCISNTAILEVINNYIDHEFIKVQKSYLKIQGFINFINELNINIDPDILISIFNNDNFNNAVKDAYKKCTIDSDLYYMIINTYEMINNIDNIDNYDDFNIYNDDSLKAYMSYIKKYPLLTKEEEHNLAMKIKKGDEKAKNKFIESNLRLPVYVALKHRNKGIEIIDLIQEGNIGLMKAVDRFNPEFNYRFSTYAYNWITLYITSAINNKSRIIRLPAYMATLVNKYKTYIMEYQSKYDILPSINEIAMELNVSREKVLECQQYANDTHRSLYELLGNDEEDVPLINFISQENNEIDSLISNVSNDEMMYLINNCGLKENEKKVILYRYGFINNKVYKAKEIATLLELTPERVRQIEISALKKLRMASHTPNLVIYSENPDKALDKIIPYQILAKKRIVTKKDLRVFCSFEKFKRTNNLTELFNNFTFEDIYNVIENLTETEKNYLYQLYDENLNIINDNDDNNILTYVYNSLLPKIHNNLIKELRKKYSNVRKKN